MSPPLYVLGSRSPRRFELLQLLIPSEQIIVLPPKSAEEAGFEGLHDEVEIARRLREVVQTKREAVEEQLSSAQRSKAVRIVADTIIVVREQDGTLTVLGQPPETSDWTASVREWFQRYYSGRTHAVWTSVSIWNNEQQLADEIVASTVTFRTMLPEEIDWYLATSESTGKAGGYALQGLASVFIDRVEGSLSNIIGLPLEVVRRFVP